MYARSIRPVVLMFSRIREPTCSSRRVRAHIYITTTAKPTARAWFVCAVVQIPRCRRLAASGISALRCAAGLLSARAAGQRGGGDGGKSPFSVKRRRTKLDVNRSVDHKLRDRTQGHNSEIK